MPQLKQVRKFYDISKESLLERHCNDSKWRSFYEELDNEMLQDIELENKLEYVIETKGRDSVEYKNISSMVSNHFNKWWDMYVRCGNFINMLSKKSITLDDDDIAIWNESISRTEAIFKNLRLLDKIVFYPIDYSKTCKICGYTWKSKSRILSDTCSSCLSWEVIFDMYEVAYEKDMRLMNTLNCIKEIVYSSQHYSPKSYDFRKKLEDRGIQIDTNIERIWNLANDELGLQNKQQIGRWEYYSPTEKIGNGIKGIFGSLFK